MTLPAIFFGFIISSFFGTAFHFWKGGGGLKLLFYVILSWIGFWAGHMMMNYMGWNFGSIGPLHALAGCVSSLIFLFLGDWLSQMETE
jgi:hypothetical protein